MNRSGSSGHGASGVLSRGFPKLLDQPWQPDEVSADPREALFEALDLQMFGFLRLSQLADLDDALMQCKRPSLRSMLGGNSAFASPHGCLLRLVITLAAEEPRIFVGKFGELIEEILLTLFDQLDIESEGVLYPRQLEQVCHTIGRSYAAAIGDAQRSQTGVRRCYWVDFVCGILVQDMEGDMSPIANTDTLARLVYLGAHYAQECAEVAAAAAAAVATVEEGPCPEDIARDQAAEIEELKHLLAEQEGQARDLESPGALEHAVADSDSCQTLGSPSETEPEEHISPAERDTATTPEPESVDGSESPEGISPGSVPESDRAAAAHEDTTQHEPQQEAEPEEWELLNTQAIERARRAINGTQSGVFASTPQSTLNQSQQFSTPALVVTPQQPSPVPWADPDCETPGEPTAEDQPSGGLSVERTLTSKKPAVRRGSRSSLLKSAFAHGASGASASDPEPRSSVPGPEECDYESAGDRPATAERQFVSSHQEVAHREMPSPQLHGPSSQPSPGSEQQLSPQQPSPQLHGPSSQPSPGSEQQLSPQQPSPQLHGPSSQPSPSSEQQSSPQQPSPQLAELPSPASSTGASFSNVSTPTSPAFTGQAARRQLTGVKKKIEGLTKELREQQVESSLLRLQENWLRHRVQLVEERASQRMAEIEEMRLEAEQYAHEVVQQAEEAASIIQQKQDQKFEERAREVQAVAERAEGLEVELVQTRECARFEQEQLGEELEGLQDEMASMNSVLHEQGAAFDELQQQLKETRVALHKAVEEKQASEALSAAAMDLLHAENESNLRALREEQKHDREKLEAQLKAMTRRYESERGGRLAAEDVVGEERAQRMLLEEAVRDDQRVMQLSQAYEAVALGPGSLTDSIWQRKCENLEKELHHLRHVKDMSSRSRQSRSRSPSNSEGSAGPLRSSYDPWETTLRKASSDAAHKKRGHVSP